MVSNERLVRRLTIASIIVLSVAVFVQIVLFWLVLQTMSVVMDVPGGFAMYAPDIEEDFPRIFLYTEPFGPTIQGMIYIAVTELAIAFSISSTTAVFVLSICQMQGLGGVYDPASSMRLATVGAFISALGGGLVPALLLGIAAWKSSDDLERQHIDEYGKNSARWKDANWFSIFMQGHDDACSDSDKFSVMVSKLCAPLSVSVPSLFLGPIYWAYRKCYKGAFLLLMLAFVMMGINIFLGAEVFGFIGPTLACVLFYRIYHAHAISVLNAGIASNQTEEDLARYMRDKGGVSPLGATVFVFLFVGGVVTLSFLAHAVWD